jgi:hypothetical protein
MASRRVLQQPKAQLKHQAIFVLARKQERMRDNPRAVGMTSNRTSSRLGVLIDLV